MNILLTSVRPNERLEAARLLAASGDLKAITALSTAAVYDNSPRVRQSATEAIAQIRGANAGLGAVPGAPPSLRERRACLRRRQWIRTSTWCSPGMANS